jgi:hypothetical protein
MTIPLLPPNKLPQEILNGGKVNRRMDRPSVNIAGINWLLPQSTAESHPVGTFQDADVNNCNQDIGHTRFEWSETSWDKPLPVSTTVTHDVFEDVVEFEELGLIEHHLRSEGTLVFHGVSRGCADMNQRKRWPHEKLFSMTWRTISRKSGGYGEARLQFRTARGGSSSRKTFR